MVPPASSRWTRRIRHIADLPAPHGCRAWVGVREGPSRFEQKVLVKVAPREDPDAVSLILREARACARLDHPAIPQVHDLYEDHEEARLILQWTDSVTLESIRDEGRRRRARMPVAAVAWIGAELFSALDAAHTARDASTREFAPIVHQGINPTAIRITPEGRLRLESFGGSRTLASFDLTPAGLLGPNEGYLAPEQLIGDRPSVRTDIYSALLVLRELLTDGDAFPRGDLDYLQWLERIAHPVLTDVTAYRSDLDASFIWLLRVGLRAERDQRTVTAAIAAEMLSALAVDGRAALVRYMQGQANVETVARAVSVPPAELEEPTTVSLRTRPLPTVAPVAAEPPRTHPALDTARTPEPVLTALQSKRPTLPSLRRRRGGRVAWALAAAFPMVAGIAWAVSAPAQRAATAEAARPAPREAAASAPAPAIESAAPVAEKPGATLEGSTIAGPEEIRRLLADTRARGEFERCFTSGDKPGNGVTLRTRCRGGPTFTFVVVRAPGHTERRIGAYTEAPLGLWSGWTRDPHAVLFSLSPYRLHPVRAPAFAVDNRDGSFGPSFGGGQDLHIAGNLQSGMSFPKSFLDRSDAAFIGAFGLFRVERLEVFVARARSH